VEQGRGGGGRTLALGWESGILKEKSSDSISSSSHSLDVGRNKEEDFCGVRRPVLGTCTTGGSGRGEG